MVVEMEVLVRERKDERPVIGGRGSFPPGSSDKTIYHHNHEQYEYLKC